MSSSEEYDLVAEAIMTVVNVAQQQIERPTIRRSTIVRDRQKASELLMKDYFVEGSTYNDKMFVRRFRMSRDLFVRICQDMEQHFDYFKQKFDGRKKLGFTPYQKCTSAIRQLGYGTSSDIWDDYLKMAEKTSRDSLYKFCKGVIHLYGGRYVRRPSWSDIQQIYDVHEEKHAFPGMLGSLDCMHWEWENCPVAWRGQFQRGDHNHPSFMLEAVASQDLWIWHAFFGVAGSNNDINVLDQSPIFNYIENGKVTGQEFIVNEETYKYGYYLVDGIYPKWAVFVKSFKSIDETNEKRNNFKRAQESARKDVERAFGVLKKKWHMIRHPARAWKPSRIRNALYACVILHNMILEDKGLAICQNYQENAPVGLNEVTVSEQERLQIRAEIRNGDTHISLQRDLIEHVWWNRRSTPSIRNRDI